MDLDVITQDLEVVHRRPPLQRYHRMGLAEAYRLLDERPSFLVDGLVHADLTLLRGVPKCGKSRLVDHLVIAAVTQGRFLGREFARPVTQAVIVATDPGSHRDHARNLREAGIHSGAPVDLIQAVGRTDWQSLRAAINSAPGALVVLDTLTGICDGELIDGPTVTATMDELSALAEAGSAVMVVHHESTWSGSGGGRSRRPMGHTAIEAMPRWHLRMEARSGGWKLTADGNSAPGAIHTLQPGEHIADFVISSSEATAKREHERDASKEAEHKAMAASVLDRPDLRSATQAEMSRELAKCFPQYTSAKQPDRAIARDLSEGRGVGRFLQVREGVWTRGGED